jgi:hypothetical protein
MKLIMEDWRTFLKEQASDRDSDRAREEEKKADLNQYIEELCKFDYVIYAALDHPRLSTILLKRMLNKDGASHGFIAYVIRLLEDKTDMSLEDIAASSLGKYIRQFAKGVIKGLCAEKLNGR